MKKIAAVFLLLAVPLLFTAVAQADPRMETNNNFCHFILDPENGDNEVFLADCAAVITVTEIVDPDQPQVSVAPGEQSECNDNYRATGYGEASKRVPALVAPIPPGETLVFTSRDSEYDCYMKESNNRTYRSEKWISRISVSERDAEGFVTVSYGIMCM